MLSQCLVPSITKKVISYLLVLGQQPLIALQIEYFHLSISMHPKANKKILIQNHLYSNVKKIKIRQKEPRHMLITKFKNIKLF